MGQVPAERNRGTMPFYFLRWSADYLDPQDFTSVMLHTGAPENTPRLQQPALRPPLRPGRRRAGPGEAARPLPPGAGDRRGGRALVAHLLPAGRRAVEPPPPRRRGQPDGPPPAQAGDDRITHVPVHRCGRLALIPPTLLLLALVTFFLGYLSPSDPIEIMLGQHAHPRRRPVCGTSTGSTGRRWSSSGAYLGTRCAATWAAPTTTRSRWPTWPKASRRRSRWRLAAAVIAVLVGVPLGCWRRRDRTPGWTAPACRSPWWASRCRRSSSARC